MPLDVEWFVLRELRQRGNSSEKAMIALRVVERISEIDTIMRSSV